MDAHLHRRTIPNCNISRYMVNLKINLCFCSRHFSPPQGLSNNSFQAGRWCKYLVCSCTRFHVFWQEQRDLKAIIFLQGIGLFLLRISNCIKSGEWCLPAWGGSVSSLLFERNIQFYLFQPIFTDRRFRLVLPLIQIWGILILKHKSFYSRPVHNHKQSLVRWECQELKMFNSISMILITTWN